MCPSGLVRRHWIIIQFQDQPFRICASENHGNTHRTDDGRDPQMDRSQTRQIRVFGLNQIKVVVLQRRNFGRNDRHSGIPQDQHQNQRGAAPPTKGREFGGRLALAPTRYAASDPNPVASIVHGSRIIAVLMNMAIANRMENITMATRKKISSVTMNSP